jgi:hypothetical protein
MNWYLRDQYQWQKIGRRLFKNLEDVERIATDLQKVVKDRIYSIYWVVRMKRLQ